MRAAGRADAVAKSLINDYGIAQDRITYNDFAGRIELCFEYKFISHEAFSPVRLAFLLTKCLTLREHIIYNFIWEQSRVAP